jgi:DNA-binding LacI/PurR family transcriptional regulator
MRAACRPGKQGTAGMSVVEFDDSRLMAFTDPSLTTARQPIATTGQAAVAPPPTKTEAEQAPDNEPLFVPELVVRLDRPGPGRLTPPRGYPGPTQVLAGSPS